MKSLRPLTHEYRVRWARLVMRHLNPMAPASLWMRQIVRLANADAPK